MSEVDYAENYMEQDDYSDNESSEGNDLKGADKRAHHNALERKRRDHIKDSFSGLRDAIPLLHGEKINSHKASRAQILKKAAEYIDHMRRKNNDHQKDIDVLKKENKLLEEKIRALEELKCAGQLKNSSNNKPTQQANTRNSKSLIVSSANNGSSNSSASTNGSSTGSAAVSANSSSNGDGGTSLLQNRVKSESVSLEDDSENLLVNTEKASVVQIVKKANVITNVVPNGKLAGGTTLLVNGTLIKSNPPVPIHHHQTTSLLGPPNKRTKRLIIAANTSIISK